MNNTIYGADGIESQFVGDPTEESNDLLSEAVITKVGRAHTGPFIATAAIGDGLSTLVSPEGDVDIYQVDLMVGDRLIIDIDTQGNVTTLAADVADTDTTITVVDASVLPTGGSDINVAGEIMQVTGANGNVLTVTRTAPVAHVAGDIVQGPMSMVPDTAVRLFNDFGVAQVVGVVNGVPTTVNNQGVAPAYLDPLSTVFAVGGRPGPLNDAGNSFDPFVDFTALETGTYYVAVSSAGNDNYDPNSLSGRTGGVGGVGAYEIGMEVYAPRTAVMSINNGMGSAGTLGADVIGTTFTITQIPDFAAGTAGTTGNQITFALGGGVAGGSSRSDSGELARAEYHAGDRQCGQRISECCRGHRHPHDSQQRRR